MRLALMSVVCVRACVCVLLAEGLAEVGYSAREVERVLPPGVVEAWNTEMPQSVTWKETMDWLLARGQPFPVLLRVRRDLLCPPPPTPGKFLCVCVCLAGTCACVVYVHVSFL